MVRRRCRFSFTDRADGRGDTVAAPVPSPPLHILVLSGRDWTHLDPQVEQWTTAGHRVTILAAREKGRPRVEHPRPGVTIHRMGSRRTIVARAAWATFRGLGRDADVVLDVAEGSAFFTPLWRWLRGPRVTSVRHLDRHLRAPHELLYRGVPHLASSNLDPGYASLDVLERAAGGPRASLREELRSSQTATASGLAAATLISNGVQLIVVVVFTRLLGADDYGSLAALVSAFLILLVGGQALQVAAARETALHHLGEGGQLSATIQAWTRHLVYVLIASCVLGLALSSPLGHLIGVPQHALAAGSILPTGVLWLLLSLQRGVLQGLRSYAPVAVSLIAESLGRLVFGLILVAAGLGVTGAFLGTPVALAATSLGLFVFMRRRLGHPEGQPGMRSLRDLTAGAWVPIAGLGLLALLQNVDVIVVKHRIGGDAAGSYAAAAVAAKAVVWIAIGIALQLLPEATRRTAAGLDPLPVLRRALLVLAVVAAPALLIFALVPELLMRLAFGPDLTQAKGALLLLGLAMTLLAVAYLTVQYMIALGRTVFLWVLGAVAIAEPFLLTVGDPPLVSYAALVLALQLAVAIGVLTLVVRGGRPARSSAPAVAP